MSARAAAYQTQITGVAPGSVYRVGGVDFDGFGAGGLQEAKGPGYASFIKDGVFRGWYSKTDDLINQARNQLEAGGGVPITWSIAEKEMVAAVKNLFAQQKVVGINVVHVPVG